MRKHLKIANFHLSYPRSWKLITEDKTDESEFCVLENSRGIKINCYVTKNGPGSQYYGGNYILENVHITKVSNIQKISKLPKFIDITQFQTPIITKIKVYSYNDGKVTDKEVEIDGSTYYAILPEDYLGDNSFRGGGYWAMCFWKYSDWILVMAESPNGKFTEEEAREVIQILSSFRYNYF